MNSGLDPANLTPAASLNRLRFTALSGLPIPAGMIDWAAYALLSAKALGDLTARHGGPEAARRFGERLGWLLVTLRLGAPASRAARSDWDESYWRHWAGITSIYLGGGIVSNEIGPEIAAHAERVLTAAGMGDSIVRVAPWPQHLPLVGAARVVSGAPSSAVVLDFGQSYVKRAIAQYRDGALAALRLAPRQPSSALAMPQAGEPSPEQTRHLGEAVVATMAEAWRAARIADEAVSSTIVASLASYIRDGQPLARQGGAYSYLLGLSNNLANWLGERLTDTLGREMTVRLLHDGTAAAMATAGEPNAAVIMLGTALGVGFPPSSALSAPLAPDVQVLGPPLRSHVS